MSTTELSSNQSNSHVNADEPQIVTVPQYTGCPSCGGLLTGGGVETQETRFGRNTVYSCFDCHSKFAMVPTVSFVLFDITKDQ